MSILEQNKINYITIDRRNNYDVEDESNNKNLNEYSNIFKKAKVEVNFNKRIEQLVEFLKEDREAIVEMEKIMYERREI